MPQNTAMPQVPQNTARKLSQEPSYAFPPHRGASATFQSRISLCSICRIPPNDMYPRVSFPHSIPKDLECPLLSNDSNGVQELYQPVFSSLKVLRAQCPKGVWPLPQDYSILHIGCTIWCLKYTTRTRDVPFTFYFFSLPPAHQIFVFFICAS